MQEKNLYKYVDVSVDVDEDGDVTIDGDGQDYLKRDEVTKLRDALTRFLGDTIPGTLIRASEVSFNEGLMRLAAVHDKTVTFRYAKGPREATIETRRLQPESVFTNKDGDLLFGGQDPDRGEYRAYRVDRIKGEVSVA